MRVHVERDARLCVAQTGLHRFHVDAVRKKLRGLRMTKLVEAEPVEAVEVDANTFSKIARFDGVTFVECQNL